MTPDVYARARSEIIALFGWNADSLTPDQKLRLDCAVALRLALDDLQGRVVRGESPDVARMLTAADALSRLLPAAALAAPPSTPREDPREHMLKTYMAMRKRGELFDPTSTYEGRGRRIAELEAKVAELEAALAGAPATAVRPAPLPDNVVKLRNDNPKPEPPPASSPPASAAPAAPPPPAKPFVNGLSDIPQSVRDTRPTNEAWRNFVRIDWQG
jgi:hypothetical protein